MAAPLNEHAVVPAPSVADDKVNILLVDDQPSRLLSYEAVLAELGENLVLATSGTEALKRLMDDEFAVILLDVNMPGMDGFETANLIHQHPRFERTPIIFVTAVSVTDLDKMTGYKLGAIDYVHVPVIPEILRSKVAVLVELFRKRRQLEQLNRDLAVSNDELAKANESIRVEKARELERLNLNLEAANRELAGANVSLEAEIDDRRRAEERLRFLAETIPSFVWTAAPDGNLTYINQRWQEYTGVPPDFSLETWSKHLVEPEDYERSRKLWLDHVASGLPYKNEARIRRSDGLYRWFMTRAVPWRDDSGQITSWFGITTDIHDQKELEERLREADRRKDEFLATLAHELRNPLAPLQNALHMMQSGSTDTVEHAQHIMDRQLRQLVRLVDDLLDVSRITRGKLVLRKELVTLENIVQAATETVRPVVESAGHHLEIALPAEPVVLDADPQRLAQVFGNLLNNACKYTEPGGTLALTATRDGDSLVVSIRDTGIGLAPEQLEGIFELFVQVDTSLERARGGLGIGLTVVKRLVDMHAGRIEVRSAGLGKGSEFVVTLPIADATIADVRPPEPVVEKADTGSERRRRVMVVDDNRDAADTLAFTLEMLGHEIRVVYDAEQVVDASHAFQPEIMFMDVGMPKLNGFEVARRIRAQEWGNDIVLVALTGWGQEEDRRRSREAGFDHHLVKPAELNEIERLCETAFRGSVA